MDAGTASYEAPPATSQFPILTAASLTLTLPRGPEVCAVRLIEVFDMDPLCQKSFGTQRCFVDELEAWKPSALADPDPNHSANPYPDWRP